MGDPRRDDVYLSTRLHDPTTGARLRLQHQVSTKPITRTTNSLTNPGKRTGCTGQHDVADQHVIGDQIEDCLISERGAPWSPTHPPTDARRVTVASAAVASLESDWPRVVSQLATPVARLFGIEQHASPQGDIAAVSAVELALGTRIDERQSRNSMVRNAKELR